MKNSKIIKKFEKSVILLQILIPEGNNKNKMSIKGTGFIVSNDGKFITCAHVYDQTPKNERVYLGAMVPGETDDNGRTRYDRFEVKLLDIDRENDVALMEIVNNDNKIFNAISNFATSDEIEEGEDIMILGYPLALELLMMKFGITKCANKCIVSSIKRRSKDGSLHFFMVDTHINNGSSGSPVFSSDSGKVIGIASGKISQRIPIKENVVADIPADMGICGPVNYIADIINKNKDLKDTVKNAIKAELNN